jgi:putative ABC transport system permease protein
MPAALIAASRSALREVNPTLPLYNARTLRSVIDQSVAQPRFNTVLLSLFAGMALLLAAIGIYGVISYSVTQRQQELGVRIALGAQTADVMRMVLGEGAMLAMLGVVVGLVGAFCATPLIGSWLFGIGTSDLRTFVAVAAALVGVALVASYLPARRATRVDPLIAMRGE